MKLITLKLPVVLCSVGLLAVGCAERHHRGGSSSVESSASVQGSGSSSGMASADAKFVKKAASGGLAEVQMGQLLQQKAQSEDLKQFGQNLINDHTQANQELMSIASQKGLSVPTQMNAEDQQKIQRLSNASGAEFDRLARQEAIQDHQKDLQEFKSAQNTVNDPQLKAFIEKSIPKLEQHLQHAEALPTTGESSATGGSEMIEGRSSSQGSATSSTGSPADTQSTQPSDSGSSNLDSQQNQSGSSSSDQMTPGQQPEPDSASPTR